jgi:hypothetical protein
MTEAEWIIQKLNRMTRHLWSCRYETVRLLFSDDSFVCAADCEPSALQEVTTLLQQSERPLGYIARLSERRGLPFVQTWVDGDAAALAKLNDTAHFWYHHRMEEKEFPMKQQIKCERTGCCRGAAYIAEERHPQGDGSVDVEHRATCEVHARERLPQNLSLLSAWQIIRWPDGRCNA